MMRARPDGRHAHHRHHHRHPADVLAGAHARPAILHHGDVGAGAAHVQRDDVEQAGLSGDVGRPAAIDRDAKSQVGPTAAQIGGVGQAPAVRRQLNHERVTKGTVGPIEARRGPETISVRERGLGAQQPAPGAAARPAPTA